MRAPHFRAKRSVHAAKRHPGRLFADLYEGNPGYNATPYKLGGRPFVVLKATQGVAHVDSLHAVRCEHSHSIGLAVGHYHYMDPDSAAAAQAVHFLDTVRPHLLQRWPLGVGHDALRLSHTDFLIVDIEGSGWRDAQAMLTAFEREVHRVSGGHHLIGYSGRSFLLEHDLHLEGGDKWWVADYPNFPTGLGRRELWAHQFSEGFRVQGITTACDASVLVDSVSVRYWDQQTV
jgi:GH25 family lysozyme M1 (1,4-beta-N-acetylmuramidase)